MSPLQIIKRKRGGRPVNNPVIRKTCLLTGRNEFAFKKSVRMILQTAVGKTIDFAGTNRACGDKKPPELPERIEAETIRS